MVDENYINCLDDEVVDRLFERVACLIQSRHALKSYAEFNRTKALLLRFITHDGFLYYKGLTNKTILKCHVPADSIEELDLKLTLLGV